MSANVTPLPIPADDSGAAPVPPTRGALPAIACLVCKQGVSIGQLSPPDLQRALALAWSCLPQDAGCTEGEINGLLRQVLDGPGRFMRTDHVELRRWLVDMGWMLRDGFGREYRAVAPAALSPTCQAAALPLAGVDVVAWVQGVRRQANLAAQQRRAAWAARHHRP
jgi:hypothetical protein